ncbi:hypothetical protein ACS5PN_03865 [Roseateles sp. NT4]|uniref:hypothetical protein n=1 Tax=Roseateles sp. NT4 TaxID=3453715 RepID=UPI003EEB9C1D
MSRDDTPGDDLAAITFTPTGGQAQADAAANEAQQAHEQAQADRQAEMLKAGMQHVLVGLLKTARTLIARRLPEIREHWSDAVLNGPAEAALPLLERHMGALMGLLGSSPELVALGLACLPLGLGYMQAVEQHRRTIEMPAGDGSAGPS